MAELIGIIGESGSGKSSSIRTLNPENTFIINVAGKPLPIKGFKKMYKPLVKNSEGKYEGNLYHTSDSDKILQILKLINHSRLDITNVIIEDAQYIMAFEAMNRSDEKNYDKFVQIASHFYSVLKEAMNMREDLKIFIISHSENTGDALNQKLKMKTIGKMLDNMITLEGLFTYVLFTELIIDPADDSVQYKFVTQSNGSTTAKTPMECFDSYYIDNDLQYVVDKINEYND
jgi:ABC-type dipeptide/oligopeptide/nickel transport system ATPase component